ncbi:Hypothetical protein A7982_10608 [Minicystis rosea]|nr:Hypothetical protein A7982_10608 [Minicystis rosea]
MGRIGGVVVWVLRAFGIAALLLGVVTLAFACSPANVADADALIRGAPWMLGIGAAAMAFAGWMDRSRRVTRRRDHESSEHQ